MDMAAVPIQISLKIQSAAVFAVPLLWLAKDKKVVFYEVNSWKLFLLQARLIQ